MDLDEMLRVDRYRDINELINFWADPDYNPDAGTRLLFPISYALQRGILLRRENPTYRYWAPVAAATRGFKMVLFTASRGNTVVGGTCDPPSGLLDSYLRQERYAIVLFVCHSVCRSVSRITAKVISRIHWNSVLWLGLPIGRTVSLFNFRWWSGPGYGFRMTFPLPSPLRNRRF